MKTRIVATVGILGGALASLAGGANAPRERVAPIIERIRQADYAGDRAALKRLRDDLAPWAADATVGSRVRYWQGFALWRRAFNGFNDQAPAEDLAADLSAAVADFDAALALDSKFVDAQIGAISCLSNLAFLHRQDAAAIQDFIRKVGPRVEAANHLDPDNPRLLWVTGANRWYAPAERGGGQTAAIATYEKGLAEARRRGASADPLEPSWGEPELLMNLGWSNLNRSTPDLDAAGRAAESALALVPSWHYVRDILLPQIRAARDKARGEASAPDPSRKEKSSCGSARP